MDLGPKILENAFRNVIKFSCQDFKIFDEKIRFHRNFLTFLSPARTSEKFLTFLRVISYLIGYKEFCRTKVTYQTVGHTLKPHLKNDLYFTVCFMKQRPVTFL